MSRANSQFGFDVAIVGGGPAGLSAAVVLGRSRRTVALFDHGKPRNYASQAVHCYLARDGIAPHALREHGRCEATSYGVQLFDAEVASACPLPTVGEDRTGFEVRTTGKLFVVRTLLLTTGVVDMLPDIPNFREFYGRSVHHCPYCDGWEHRDQHLVAFGVKNAPVDLAISLKTWSPNVTLCSNGHAVNGEDRKRLAQNKIVCRAEKVAGLDGRDGALSKVLFETGPPLRCEALFFSADQVQRSPLATMLGCEYDENGLVQTGKKQKTGVNGLFVAGDADGEVQFAIVAAAEGAVAAVAINALLQKQDESAQERASAAASR